MASSPAAGASGTHSGTKQYVDYEEYVDYQLEKTRSSIKLTDVFTTLTALSVAVIGYLLLFVVFDQWVIDGGFGYSSRVALLSLLVVGIFGTLSWRVLLPLVRSIHPLYAARVIEQADPNLQSNLVNFVDVRQSSAQSAPMVLKAMEKRAAVELSHIDVEEAVDRRPLLRIAYALLGVVVVAGLYIVLSPKDPFASVRRALLPTAPIDVATETTISDVNPGDKEVAARTVLTVEANVRGKEVDRVEILYSTADHKYVDQSVKMDRVEAGLPAFRGVLNGENGRGLLQNLKYRMTAGDARTREYTINVIQPPSARADEVQCVFPSYMELEEKTTAGGHIDGWEGATVTLKATANMPVKSAKMIFTDNEDASDKGEEITMQVAEGTKLSATWKLEFRSDGTSAKFYHIQVKSENGDVDPEPAQYTVRIRPDQRPEVALLAPTSDLTMPANGTIPLIVQAADPDFKLRSIALKAEKSGESIFDRKLFESEKLGQSFRGNYDFALSDMRKLAEGDTIQFWIEVKDNKQPTANRATTPRINVHIGKPVSAEEVKRELAEEKKKQNELARANDPVNPEERDNPPPPEAGNEGTAKENPPRPDQPEPDDKRNPREKQRPENEPKDRGNEKNDGGESGQKKPGAGNDFQDQLKKLLDKERQEQQPGKTEEGGAKSEEGQGKKEERGAKGDERKEKNEERGAKSEEKKQKGGEESKPENASGDKTSKEDSQSGGKKSGSGKKQANDQNREDNKDSAGDKQSGAGKKQANDKNDGDNKDSANDKQSGAGKKQANDKNEGDSKDSASDKQSGAGNKQANDKNEGESKDSAGDKQSGAGKKQANDKNEGESKDTAGDKQSGAGKKQKNDKNEGDSKDSAGDKQSGAGKKQANDKNNGDSKDSAGDKQSGGDKKSGKDDKQAAKPDQPGKGDDQEANSKGPDQKQKQKSGGAGKKASDKTDAAANSDDQSPAKGAPAKPDAPAGDDQSGDGQGEKTKKNSDGKKKTGADTENKGTEEPAADSPDAKKQKASGKEQGPATGDEEGDPSSPKAQNDLKPADGSKPGAKKKSTSDSDPGDGKSAQKRKPQDGTKEGSEDPDHAQRPADGKKSTDQPGELDEPRSEPSEKKKSAGENEKRPGEPPDAGDQKPKGPGRKDGQKSDQADTGEEGSSAATKEGKKGANKTGAGDKTDEAGDKDKSSQKTGQAGKEKGKGSTTKPSEDGKKSSPSDGKCEECDKDGNPTGKAGSKSGGKSGGKSGKPGEDGSSEGKSSKPGSQGKSGNQKGESGEGESGDKSGEQQGKKSGGQDGKSASGESGSKSGSKDGQSSSQPGKAGAQSGQNKIGGGINSPSGEGDGQGSAPGAPGEEPKPRDPTIETEPPTAEEEAADLEAARKATNLVLKRLKSKLERGEVDQELLDEMGWKDTGDVERFVKHLEDGMKAQAVDNSPEAVAKRLQFEELLRSMRLGTETQRRDGSKGQARDIRQFGTRNVPVPPEYRKLYESYTRSLSKSAAKSAEKKAEDKGAKK